MAHRQILLPALGGLLLLAACGAPRQAVQIEPIASRTAGEPARIAAERTMTTERATAGPPQNLSGTPAPERPTVPAPALPSPAPDPHPTAAGDPALRDAIEAALGDDLAHYSVVVRRLRDGRGVELNAEREFYAASLFKLALLYEAERRRGVGLLDFDDTVELTERDVAADLGTLSLLGATAGDHIPLGEAVRAMVTLSDNTSAVLLLYLLGPSAVDRTLRALGLQHTSVNTTELPTTATDMALLMEAIVRGEGVEPAWRDDMLALLLAQQTRSGIPRLLPPGVRCGNKTGTWPGATHDVAFVDAPGGTYVIAVLSDRDWGWDPIARVSRAVYDVMARS